MSQWDKETGIWYLDIAKKRHQCDYMLAAIIGTKYEPKSLIDLGCGDGKYCAIFNAYGWNNIYGIEGTPRISEVAKFDNIIQWDLTAKEHNLGDDFKGDLVLCLEVGEHIPKDKEQIFIDNVVSFVDNKLIMSWGYPGQYSASGHVNCQPTDYIIKEFEKRGLKYNNQESQLLREHASFDWFQKTLMVFDK